MRTYAFLKDGVVEKIVSATEEDFSIIMKSYQLGVDIQDMSPQPQVGWLLKGSSLCAPYVAPISPADYCKINVYRPAISFCAGLMETFISENIAMGITQTGKTKAVGEALRELDFWVSKGSLYEVLMEIAQIEANLDPNWAPFITLGRMEEFKSKILAFLQK